MIRCPPTWNLREWIWWESLAGLYGGHRDWPWKKRAKKKHALPSTTTSLPMSKGRKSQVRTKYASFRSLRFGRYPWLPCGRPVIPHCFCVWIYPQNAPIRWVHSAFQVSDAFKHLQTQYGSIDLIFFGFKGKKISFRVQLQSAFCFSKSSLTSPQLGRLVIAAAVEHSLLATARKNTHKNVNGLIYSKRWTRWKPKKWSK